MDVEIEWIPDVAESNIDPLPLLDASELKLEWPLPAFPSNRIQDADADLVRAPDTDEPEFLWTSSEIPNKYAADGDYFILL